MNKDRGINRMPLFVLRDSRGEIHRLISVGAIGSVCREQSPARGPPLPGPSRIDNGYGIDTAQTPGLLRRQLEALQIPTLRLFCCESDDFENLYLWRTR